MADTKFTAGHWIASQKHSSKVGLPIVASPHGRSIASVTFFGLGENFKNHDDESYANAHLIAAAPELYEALYRLVRDCEIAGLQEQAGFDCWINMANKALAKARGEAA